MLRAAALTFGELPQKGNGVVGQVALLQQRAEHTLCLQHGEGKNASSGARPAFLSSKSRTQGLGAGKGKEPSWPCKTQGPYKPWAARRDSDSPMASPALHTGSGAGWTSAPAAPHRAPAAMPSAPAGKGKEGGEALRRVNIAGVPARHYDAQLNQQRRCKQVTPAQQPCRTKQTRRPGFAPYLNTGGRAVSEEGVGQKVAKLLDARQLAREGGGAQQAQHMLPLQRPHLRTARRTDRREECWFVQAAVLTQGVQPQV